jgi:hypothetical protein
MSSITDLQKQQITILFGKLLQSANTLHLAHWKTQSYAKHKALGNLYEEIRELADKLVESYQGEYGIQSIKVGSSEYTEPVALLKGLLESLKTSQPLFKDSDYLNVIDELKTAIKVGLYKLQNLS